MITDAPGVNNELTITYAGSGTYTITDTADTVSSSVPGSVQVSANSQTVPVGTDNSIIVNLTDGSDTVTIDASTTFPATNAVVYNAGSGSSILSVAVANGVTIPAGGITFTGNAAATSNALELSGNGQSVTVTADGATGGAGGLSDGTGTISFTGATGIDMDGVATADFKSSAGDAAVEVINGTDFTHGGADAAIRVQPSSTTGTGIFAGRILERYERDRRYDLQSRQHRRRGHGRRTVDSAGGVAATVANLTIDTGGGPTRFRSTAP